MSSVEPIVGAPAHPIRLENYVSRWDFILSRSRGKSVLHLGCVGETEGTTEQRVSAAAEGRSLHGALLRVAERVIGVDNAVDAVVALRRRGHTEIVQGDVLDRSFMSPLGRFDLILCGDLIEHLANPGSMLEAIKSNMSQESDLLITTPNSFGALAFARNLLGVYREGSEHVLSFTIHTLSNLLRDHGFVTREAYSCYNRPASTARDRLRYGVGIPVFRLLPKVGGTLLIVARLTAPANGRSTAAP